MDAKKLILKTLNEKKDEWNTKYKKQDTFDRIRDEIHYDGSFNRFTANWIGKNLDSVRRFSVRQGLYKVDRKSLPVALFNEIEAIDRNPERLILREKFSNLINETCLKVAL